MTMRKLIACLLLLALLGCSDTSEIRFVHVNGVDLGYRTMGQGEPLLMIMGYAGTMDAWEPALVDELAESYQVILFDNRNVGHSSTSSETVTIPLMARDGLGLLHALDIESAHVLGWSMGSIIAQEMALAAPDRVRKLVLYGSAFEPGPVMEAIKRFDGLTPSEFAAMLFPRSWAAQHPDIHSSLPVPSIPATPGAINRQKQALAIWEGTADRLPALDRDVLLLVGQEDDITPPDQSLKMAAMIRGAWLVRFRGAGHWLMYQAPEEMSSAIHEFLEGRQNLLH